MAKTSLADKLKMNFTEIWLGLLLFLGLPIVVMLYTDYRGFIATSFLLQTLVLILYTYKGNK